MGGVEISATILFVLVGAVEAGDETAARSVADIQKAIT